MIGIEGVVRDHTGKCCAAFATTITGSFGPYTADCLALREGLRLVRELGFHVHEVESDALNVVTAVHEIEPSLDAEGVVLDDIRELLSILHNPSVSHIMRSANNVAHLLSRFAFNFRKLAIWINETPSCKATVVSVESIAI